jgi:kumamolisin
VSATLVLRTPDPAATAALAASAGLSRATRLDRLRAGIPSPAVRAQALLVAAGLGLTVDHVTPWTVVVHGSARAVALLAASGRSLGSSVSSLPSLVPQAASVVVAGARIPHAPLAKQDVVGSDLLRAYSASPAPLAPGVGHPVIATLQYAGWDPADLTAYARATHLPSPAVGAFQAVSVDGASTTAVVDASTEVAIDQESIYAVDPYAYQRAYFVDGTVQGDVDAYYQMAADALTGPGIVALSVSWATCEQEFPAAAVAEHSAITALVATGVTVFAGSGDNGSFCEDPGRQHVYPDMVSYPASDPAVVAVGGTTLDTVGPVETAWGAPDDIAASGFSGSGGGVSGFARPPYQDAVAPASPYREVPDIAADADPVTGMVIVHDFGGGPEAAQIGGTSLSSPVSAALLTAELGSRGLTNGGVGDIHAALYAAPAGSFRDITVGTNSSYSAGTGYDMVTGLGAPHWHAIVDQLLRTPVVHARAVQTSRTIQLTVRARAGQDFLAWATGTGSPPACGTDLDLPAAPAAVVVPKDGVYQLWAQGYLGYQRCLTGTTTVVVDHVAPGISLRARASSPAGRTVAYSWAVSDAVSGVRSVNASVLRNGKPIWSGHSTGAGRVTLKGRLGSSYQLVVSARDKAGNLATSKRVLGVSYDDQSFRFSGGWSRATSHAAFGGRLVTSTRAGAAARAKAYGSTFSLLTTTCASCGIAEVFVDGRHVRDVSLYSRSYRPQSLVRLASFGSARLRSVVLVVKGAKAARSKGVVVNVDGLLAV